MYSKVNQLYVYLNPLFFGFPSHLEHLIEFPVLYTVSSHKLSILYVALIVYICQSQSPNSSHSHAFPLGIYMFVLYVCVSRGAGF